ncbi:MAG: DUF3352 domain-containing protein [Candidatus Eremiobacteraeota bacterium]|nr:DUF3352 domain-containing protein [Candidatus Eremiobacteraeota bacterium]
MSAEEAARKPKVSRRGAAFLLVIAAVCAGLLLLYRQRELTLADPLTMLPASSRLVISIDAVPLLSPGKNLEEYYSRWKNTDGYRFLAQALKLKWKLDLDSDFLSWAGPRIAMASNVLDESPHKSFLKWKEKMPRLIIAASIRDGNQAKKVIEKLEKRYRDTSSVTHIPYRGADIFSPDLRTGPHFCIYRHFLIIADSIDDLQKAIDAGLDRKSALASDRAFRESCATLPSPRFVTAFCNLGREKLSSDHSSWCLGAIKKKEGIVIDSVLKDDKTSPGASRGGDNDVEIFSMPRALPESTSFFLVLNSRKLLSIEDALPGAREKRTLSKALRILAVKLRMPMLEGLSPKMNGEIGISIDIGSMLSTSLIESISGRGTAPKLSPENLPGILTLGFREKISGSLPSLLDEAPLSTLQTYKDHTIYSRKNVLVTPLDTLLCISLDGTLPHLELLIDTYLKSRPSIAGLNGFKVLSEGVTGGDLLCGYLKLDELEAALKLYSFVKPELKKLVELIGPYRAIWLKMTGEASLIRTRVFLEYHSE